MLHIIITHIYDIKTFNTNIDVKQTNRRKQDIVRIIASNKKLKNFIKWRPKYNSLNAIVKSCLNWEKKQKYKY